MIISFEQYRNLVEYFFRTVGTANYNQLKAVFSNADYLRASVGQLTLKGKIKVTGTVRTDTEKTTVFEFVG